MSLALSDQWAGLALHPPDSPARTELQDQVAVLQILELGPFRVRPMHKAGAGIHPRSDLDARGLLGR